jgi:molybdopterin-guanine dinucleotide biosynthesis protein B/molybdopterin-guanine dinucleotide biosynthesis protein
VRPLSDDILIVGDLVSTSPYPSVRLIPDAVPHHSSLMGVYTGLLAARHELAVVVGCDMPFLSLPVLRLVASSARGHDVAVPKIGSNFEMLHAAYRRTCLPAMTKALERQSFRLLDILPEVDTLEIEERELRQLDPELRSFTNVNTPADQEKVAAITGVTPGPLRRDDSPPGTPVRIPPAVSFVAKSGTGKTTVLEQLIPELVRRGLVIGVLKHHAHATPFDVPGKDTYRLAQAGARVVVGAGKSQVAVFRQEDGAAHLEAIIARDLAGMDLVLIEGFRRGTYPKIEVHRKARSPDLLCDASELLALVTDERLNVDVPQFSLEDAPGLAAFLCDWLGTGRVRP